MWYKLYRIAQHFGVAHGSVQAEDLEYNYEKKGLADLRGRLIAAIAAYNGKQCSGQDNREQTPSSSAASSKPA